VRSPRLAVPLLCALAAAAPARADDIGDILKGLREKKDVAAPAATPAPAPACTDGITARPGKFCDNVQDCIRFCSCACRFDEHLWRDVKDDGSTTCTGMPESGVGMLPTNSPDLLPVPALPYLSVPAGVKATQDALDGLRRLSDHLAASESRGRLGYTVRVGSCYRKHQKDSVPECGFVLKAKYMLDRVTDPQQRENWLFKANPMNLGLTWPGRTPHSAGYGCDLILQDAHGTDCFDWRAGVSGSQSCSIEQRVASRMMDEEATNPDVGAKRLNYEAWHYEWGPSASGCQAPDCADSHWPPRGHP
jgi:hypothetical protein